MTFSSVVSYHTNPIGCGVANFSKQLADRLGVPFVGFAQPLRDFSAWGDFPLFSIKWAEVYSWTWPLPKTYGLFWHDRGPEWLNSKASVVYHADPSLGPNGLWCPSLLKPSKPRTVRLFSFGMANRLQTAHYAKVRSLLEAAGLDYRLRVSVGLHEGTSLSDATQHFDALKDIMGADKVTILGCLSDDAVAEELDLAHYVLAFFETGLRANNTTVHAALDAGCHVIANTDDHTPIPLALRVNTINGMADWFRPLVACDYSWDNLIAEMERLCVASQSTAV